MSAGDHGKRVMNVRLLAAQALVEVLYEHRSLSQILSFHLERCPSADRALLQELAFGTLRFHPRLERQLAGLMQKPLKARDADVQALLLLGLYQLGHMRIPPHAAVSETVEAASALGKPWAKGLINGVLRNFLRQAPVPAQDEVARYAHPAWLIGKLRKAWPQDWEAILEANNDRPPMTLRVNAQRTSRADYLARLAAQGIAAVAADHAPEAVVLTEPMDARALPGFAEGAVSVQDAAAQLAAGLMDLRPGQRVLDACAAPGGKTCHMLELQPDLAMVAVDQEASRLERVTENLRRLQLAATLVCADAGAPARWWDGQPFDRILLDAPCSATGVIRRHPDIKALRRPDDIPALAQTQHAMLEALWPLLQRGGRLVYATCSVLPQENAAQIERFLAEHADAEAIPIETAWGRAAGVGRQVLPGESGMDGFFYACLRRA